MEPEDHTESKLTKAEINRQNLRNFMAKKKKEVSVSVDNSTDRDKLEKLIEERKERELIQHIPSMEVNSLIELVLGENNIKTRMLIDTIKLQMMEFIAEVNAIMGKKRKELQAYYQGKQKQITYLVNSLIKSLIEIQKQSRNEYLEVIKGQLQKQESLFSFLLPYIKFQDTKRLLVQAKSPIQMTKYIQDLLQSHYCHSQAALFSEYLKTYKFHIAWQTQIFSMQDDPSIYTLQHLPFNVLHHFATKIDFQQFSEFMKRSDQKLINQFNNIGQTPIDIALRLFPIKQLTKLLGTIKQNQIIQVSTNSLNNLLQNINIIQSQQCLIEFIEELKRLSSRGYLDRVFLKTGIFDIVEYFDETYILSHVDSRMSFPLLKYLTLYGNHNIQVIRSLLFKDLSGFKEYYQLSIMLNGFWQRMGLFLVDNFKLRSVRIQSSLKESQFQNFDIYVRETVQKAIKLCSDDVILMLVQFFGIYNLYSNSIGKGANFQEHCLLQILRSQNLKKVADEFIHRLFKQKIQFQPLQLSEEEVTFISKQLNLKQQNQLVKIQGEGVNLINQLLVSMYQSGIEGPHVEIQKKKFKQYYSQHTNLYQSTVIRNGKKLFLINRLQYFMDREQLTSVLEVLQNYPKQQRNLEFFNDALETKSVVVEILADDRLESLLQECLEQVKNCCKNQQIKISYILACHFKITKCLKPFYLNIFEQGRNWLKQSVIKRLFDLEEIDLLTYLQTSDIFSLQIIESAIDRLTSQDNKICRTILKNRSFKVSQSRESLQFQLKATVTVKKQSTFIKQCMEYATYGVDSQLSIVHQDSLVQIVEKADIDGFQKQVFLRMLYENKTYLESVLSSDDAHFKRVQEFMDNDICVYNFRKKKRKITFELQHGRCNYDIMLRLLSEISKLKINDESYIRKAITNLLWTLNHRSQTQIINPVFQRLYLRYFEQQQFKTLPLNSLEQYEERLVDEKQVMKSIAVQLMELVPKLNKESLEMIRIQQYKVLGRKCLKVLVQICPRFDLKRIADIIETVYSQIITENKVLQDEENDEKSRSQIEKLNKSKTKRKKKLDKYSQNSSFFIFWIQKTLLSQMIKYETDGSSYRRVLNHFKKCLSQQDYQNQCYRCLLQLCYHRQEIAYKHYQSFISELNNIPMTQFLSIVRFKGYPPLILSLYFDKVQMRQFSTMVLVEDGKIYRYCSQKVLFIFFSNPHFELFVECAIKIISIRKNYPQNLEFVFRNLAKYQCYDKLGILIRKLGEKQISVQQIYNIFDEMDFEEHSHEGKQIAEIAYQILKNKTKQIRSYKELYKIYRQKPQVLKDFAQIQITFNQWLKLIYANHEYDGLLNYHSQLDAEQTEHIDPKFLNKVIKKMIRQLYPERVKGQSKNYYKTVYLNLLKICQYKDMNSHNHLKYYPQKIKNMIVHLMQGDKELQSIYDLSGSKFPKRLLASQSLTSYDSFFEKYPDILDHKPNRQYLTKFGKRQNLRKYLVFFTPDEFQTMLIYCNDLSIFLDYSIKLPKEKIRSMVSQCLAKVLSKSPQSYIIQLISHYNLYKQSVDLSWEGGMNIFHIVSFKKYTKLFNRILQWASNTNNSIQKSQLLSALECAKESNFYQYKYIPQTILSEYNVVGFKTSTRFLINEEVDKTLAESSFIKGFHDKLNVLKQVKNILTSATVNKVEDKVYSLTIHELLVNFVFGLKHITIQQMKAIGAHPFRTLLGMRFLQSGIKNQEILYLKIPFISILMLYCYTTNKNTLQKLKQEFTSEYQIAELMCSYFGKQICFPNQDKLPLPSYLIQSSLIQNSKLTTFIFKHYSKEIASNLTSNILIQNSHLILYLLPRFNQQRNAKQDNVAYKKALEHLRENNKSKYDQAIIMNWCCFENLSDTFEQLVKDIQGDNLYSLNSILLQFNQLEQVSLQKTTLEKQTSQQLLKKIYQKFLPKLSVSTDIQNSIKAAIDTITERNYRRLSILSVYIHLSSMIKEFERESTHLHSDIQIELSCVSSIRKEEQVITVICQTIIKTDKIVYIQSSLMHQLRSIIKSLENMLWINFNFSFLDDKIRETITEITQKAQLMQCSNLFRIQHTVDYQSFQQIDTTTVKEKVFSVSQLHSDLGILQLKKIFKSIIQKMITKNVFEINDVSAPHRFHNIIIPEFYKLVDLPESQLKLRFVSETDFNDLKKKENQLINRDIKQYERLFINRIHEKQEEYTFFNEIIYSFFNSKVHVLLNYMSIYNIMQVFHILNKFKDEVTAENTNFNIRLNMENFIDLAHKLRSQMNLFETLSKLVQNKNLITLIKYLIKVINSIAPNTNSSVSGIKINLRKVEEKEEGVLILRHPDWKLYRLAFEINEPIMEIYIEYSILESTPLWEDVSLNPELIALFDHQKFMDCLFSSVQKLTNYFLNKAFLDYEMINISKRLTLIFSKMTNISIDYKSLYKVIQGMKHRNMWEIQAILGQFSSSLSSQILTKLTTFLNSNGMVNYYDILLHQRAYDINHPFVQDLETLKYEGKNEYIKFIMNLTTKLATPIKNTFLIQLYKSQFLNHLVVNNEYLFGMKNNSIEYIKVVDRKSMNAIDLGMVKWVLLVSATIPTEAVLPKDKIIRVAICDIGGNIYLINGLKQYLFKKQLSIHEMIPIIPDNFTIVVTKNDMIEEASADTLLYQINQRNEGKIRQVRNPKVTPTTQMRSKFQPLIYQFFQNVGIKMEVEVSFETKEQIRDTEHITEMFQMGLNSLFKALQEYLMRERVPYIQEIAATVDPHFNLKQGCFFSKRVKILKKYISSLHLRLTQRKTSVTISNNQIVIQIGCSEDCEEKPDPRNILECFLSSLCTKYQQYLFDEYKLRSKVKTILNVLILFQLQQKSVELVRRVFPNLNYSIEIVEGKTAIRSSENNVSVLINQNRIFSFAEIMSVILKTKYNNCILQYQTARIQLNEIWSDVREVIIIPNDVQESICSIKLNLKDTSNFQLKVPEDSIFVVVGDALSWGKTSSKVFFKKLIQGSIGEQITFNLDILTNEKCISSLDKYQLTYKNTTGNHSLSSMITKASLITRNILEVVIVSTKHQFMTINPPKAHFPLVCKSTQEFNINIISESDLAVENTKFIGIIRAPDKKLLEIKNILELEKDEDLKEPALSTIIEEPKQNIQIQCIKQERPFTVLRSQFQYLTKAGVERVDVIELCDVYRNSISCDPSKLNIFFQFSQNCLLRIYPKISQKQESYLYLHWTPIVRGRYDLIINGIVLSHNHEIAVCASEISIDKLKLYAPKQTSVNYCQELQFSVQYRDGFGNIFGDVEYMMNEESILFQVVSKDPSLSFRMKDVDNRGVQTGYFMVDDATSTQNKVLDVDFLFMKQILQHKTINVNGLPVQKRKEFFEKQLQKCNKNRQRTLEIKRSNFIEELISHVEEDLNAIYNINFKNQPGIDAGGLKRQFYDTIGSQMKNQKYGFFIPILKARLQYTFHPLILKNKKKQVYVRCFGKFLANSILNGYHIGIDFTQSFIKVLYQLPVTFDDLKGVLEPKVFERYQSLLSLEEQQFESMYLTFTEIGSKQKEIELVPSGKDIPVTKLNVNKYLDCLAQYELQQKYMPLFKVFLDGFNEVFPFGLIKNWFKPTEFFILTCGNIQISCDSVLEVLVFPDQKPTTTTWFKRYIKQAPKEILCKFLKFTTGSSSLPYDLSSTRLTIQFYNCGPNPSKLPISHTCWKSIQIPIYRTYQIMQQKLNAAFLYACEGFGFG